MVLKIINICYQKKSKKMNKFVVLLSVILTLNISLYGQGKWIQKANFPGVATHEGVGFTINGKGYIVGGTCLLYTSPSPRDRTRSRMPSSA